MATYERRRRELKDAFTKIQSTLPIEEVLNLADAMDRYFAARDEVLTSLFAIVGDTGDNKRESDWKDKLARGCDALKNTLDNALRSVELPTLARLAFEQMAVADENRFWSSLEKLNLGTRRDDLMLLGQNLEWYVTILEKKWETMKVENGALEDYEKRATSQIAAMVDEAIGQTAPLTARLKEAVTATGEAILNIPREIKDSLTANAEARLELKDDTAKMVADACDAIMSSFMKIKLGEYSRVLDAGKAAVENYAVFLKGDYSARVLEYRDKIRRQTDGILVVFSQTRRDTDEFIKKNGFDVAKAQYQEAKDALNRWITDLPTDGLKSDGKEFADALADGLSRHLTGMETMFNRFVSQNQGRFFGPVGPDIEQALLETRFWDDTLATLVGKGLEAKLREWRSDAHQFLEINLEDTFRQLDSELRDMPQEVQDAIRALAAGFRDEVMRQARERVEEINKTDDETRRLAGADQMRQDLDRKLLQDVLRR